MSNTPAMPRTLGGTEEFERRMRMIGKLAASPEDPLAELARLVGQDDPFKRVLAQGRSKPAQGRQEPTFTEQPSRVVEPPYQEREADEQRPAPEVPESDPHQHGAAEHFAAFDHEFRGSFESADHSSEEAAEAGHPDGAGVYDENPYAPVSVGDHRQVEVSPDSWAQPEAPDRTSGPEGGVLTADRDPVVQSEGSSRRTLIVLAAVVVLTGGGLAASFLARPSSNAALALGVAPPTIQAAAGPTKVQPPAPASGDEGTSESSTLLDKNKNDGTATAKVVNSVEQPVDLNQAVKPTHAADDQASAASPFPEPRKVKTIMVRPDGSVITNPDGAMAAPQLADVTGITNQQANLAFDSHTAIPMPGPSAPPITDTSAADQIPPAKSTARVATTPHATDTAAGDSQTSATPKPKQAAAPIHARPKPKPVEEASAVATPDSGAATTGGGYAVQLGAPPSEQEAKETSNRLQKKFADQLGAYRPAIHEGKAGDKSVYRIRVGNLTQDDAKSLCSKLQSSGGACFVVRN